MPPDGSPQGDAPPSGPERETYHLFRFGPAQFNEASQELWVAGQRRQLAAKPRALLRALLAQPDMVVGKKDLEASVWPEKRFVDEGSLTTAAYNLRTALGADGRDLVQTVSGLGYKLMGPVVASPIDPAPYSPLTFKVGDAAPGRAFWRLERRLRDEPRAEVWLARHATTQEQCVIKFASAPEGLDALRREASQSRLLEARLGAREDIVPVSDAKFDDYPFYIITPYAGPDLAAWMALTRSGPAAPDLAARVGLVAEVARTLGDAHDAGVPHGAVRPVNIFVESSPAAPPGPRLAGFGADPGGASPYAAPEASTGASPTLAGDIYALGILLYQAVVGDLSRQMAAGWERDVDDALLREDIAAAAAGDPAVRLESARALATRLDNLDGRRLAAEAEAARAAEHEELSRTAELRRLEAAHAVERTRRARLAAIVLGALLFAASGLAVWAFLAQATAVAERDRANKIARVAEDAVSGIIDDMARDVSARSILTLSDLRALENRARSTVTRLATLTPDGPLLRRLEARDLIRLADTDLHQGDLTGALGAARRAVSLQAALLREDPSDPVLLVDLADSERWIGDIAVKRLDYPGALKAYAADLDNLHLAARLPGHDPRLPLLLARAYDAIGAVRLLTGDAGGALVNGRVALNLITSNLPAHSNDPVWLLDLSRAQEWIGDALDGEKDWRGALAMYQADLAIRKRLTVLDPENMRNQRDVAVALSDIGDDQTELKDLAGAQASFREEVTLNQERVFKDPSNAQWQRDLAGAYFDLGDVIDRRGDPRAAADLYQKPLAIMRLLSAKDPTDIDFAVGLMKAEFNVGDALDRAGDRGRAIPYAAAALADVRRLARAHPDDEDLKDDLQQTEALAKRLGLK